VNGYVKFSSVVVANGQVFVGNWRRGLAIFGLLAPGPTPTATTPTTDADADHQPHGWRPDQRWRSGGSRRSSPIPARLVVPRSPPPNAVDTSAVTNAAPQAVYQSNRFGTFNYAIPGLTAGGSYKVRLHFAENLLDRRGATYVQRPPSTARPY